MLVFFLVLKCCKRVTASKRKTDNRLVSEQNTHSMNNGALRLLHRKKRDCESKDINLSKKSQSVRLITYVKESNVMIQAFFAHILFEPATDQLKP